MKSKKEIILNLKKFNPNISAAEAAEQSNATLAYAKRILAAEEEKLNGVIAEIGRKHGFSTAQLQIWCEWITSSLSSDLAKQKFEEYLKYKEFKERTNV